MIMTRKTLIQALVKLRKAKNESLKNFTKHENKSMIKLREKEINKLTEQIEKLDKSNIVIVIAI